MNRSSVHSRLGLCFNNRLGLCFGNRLGLRFLRCLLGIIAVSNHKIAVIGFCLFCTGEIRNGLVIYRRLITDDKIVKTLCVQIILRRSDVCSRLGIFRRFGIGFRFSSSCLIIRKNQLIIAFGFDILLLFL